MEEKDVIQLLRHYRHDLMNHLQIIQGYASMGKIDKVQQKLQHYMAYLQEEGKLVNLHAPALALYLLQFDSLHMNFRLTYHVHTNHKDLQSADQLLVKRCRQVMTLIENASDEMELYELDVQLYDESSAEIVLAFTVNGSFPETSSLGNEAEYKDNDIAVYKSDSEMKCIVSVICK